MPAHAHAYTREAEPTTTAAAAARPALMSEAGESLHRALQASRSFRSLSGRVAQELAAQVDSGRIDLADALHVVTEADEREAIRQAAEQDSPTPGGLAKYLGGCMRRAQRGDAKRAAKGSQPRRHDAPSPGQPAPMAPYEVPPEVAAALAVPEEVYARRHREQRAADAARAAALRAAQVTPPPSQAAPTVVGSAVKLGAALPPRLAAPDALSVPGTAADPSVDRKALLAPVASQQSASAVADSERSS